MRELFDNISQSRSAVAARLKYFESRAAQSNSFKEQAAALRIKLDRMDEFLAKARDEIRAVRGPPPATNHNNFGRRIRVSYY